MTPAGEDPCAPKPVAVAGRYAIFDELARGGMATVHLGRLRSVGNFSRTVAVKRLHSSFAEDPEFVEMLLDEARLSARIRHPHVVPILDVVRGDRELFLVMEYVHGESLARLLSLSQRRRIPLSPRFASAVVTEMLHGLHAAHEARDELGRPLDIVHRDVSPQNVLVGADGRARVLDFGVAKAQGRLRTTSNGAIKGKLGYMAPEQLAGEALDRRVDVWAAGVVLWEALTGRRLFRGAEGQPALLQVMNAEVEPPSRYVPIPHEVDRIVLRALSRDREARFSTAQEMARALERWLPPDGPEEVARRVELLAGDSLAERAALVARLERAILPQAEVSAPPPAEGATQERGSRTRPFAQAAAGASGTPRESELDDLVTAPLRPVEAPSRQAPAEEQSQRVMVVERTARGASPRTVARWVGAATLGAVAVAGGVLLARGGDAERAAAPATSASVISLSDPVAHAPAAPSSRGVGATDPGAAPSAFPVAAGAVAAGGTAPPASGRPGSGPTRPSSGPARALPRAARVPACDPPYVVGDDGIRRYRRECL